MNCPICGHKAALVSPGNHLYGPSWRCYNGSGHSGEYTFNENHSGVDRRQASREAANSLSLSRANSAGRSDPTPP